MSKICLKEICFFSVKMMLCRKQQIPTSKEWNGIINANSKNSDSFFMWQQCLQQQSQNKCRENKTLTISLFLSPCDDVANTLKEVYTHLLQTVPWMCRVWASNRVKSVSLSYHTRETDEQSKNKTCTIVDMTKSSNQLENF